MGGVLRAGPLACHTEPDLELRVALGDSRPHARWQGESAAVPDLAALFGPSKRLFAPGELSGKNNPTVQVGLALQDRLEKFRP